MLENKGFYVMLQGKKVVVSEKCIVCTCDLLEQSGVENVRFGNVKRKAKGYEDRYKGH